jgi:hypothetical protein
LHPTHAIKASELDQGRSLLFLAQQNKNRLTLEATDDLGTLIVDPMSGNVRLVAKSVRNLVLRPIRQLGINGR